jgi:hypothetical protein
MSAAFVPLAPGVLPTVAASATTRLKPISSTPSSFEPMTAANLKADGHGPVATSQTPHGPPKITLERQGETITHIRIECSCGQVTELKCEY